MKLLFIKLQRFFSRSPFLDNERGQFVAMGAVLAVIFFIVTGLSVSEGQLAYKKIQLRRAVDASAIMGMNSYVENLNDGMVEDDAEDRATADAKAILNYNLSRCGMTANTILEPGTFSTVDDMTQYNFTASVTIGSVASNLFKIPKKTVSASATARKNIAYIVMVLDTSGSMEGTKLTNAKKAAKGFIRKFNLSAGQDRIAIISFNSNATVLAGLNDNDTGAKGTGKQYADLLCGVNNSDGIIGGLSANGYTNFAAAFVAARQQLEYGIPSAKWNAALKYIVFMSDGAPTAMSARWADPASALPLNFPQNDPDAPTQRFYSIKLMSGIDTVSYFRTSTRWDPDTDPGTAPPANTTASFYGGFYNDPNDLIPPIDIIPRWYYSSSIEYRACRLSDGWLSNLGYIDSKGNPGSNGIVYNGVGWNGILWGSGVTNFTTSGVNAPGPRELYNAGIIESDYAKDRGITIYVIGLGTPHTGDLPYNDVSDSQSLHPNYLRRIANAQPYTDGTFITLTDSGSVAVPTTASKNPAHRAGVYLETPTSDKLVELFNTIAQKIKLRLIA